MRQPRELTSRYVWIKAPAIMERLRCGWELVFCVPTGRTPGRPHLFLEPTSVVRQNRRDRDDVHYATFDAMIRDGQIINLPRTKDQPFWKIRYGINPSRDTKGSKR